MSGFKLTKQQKDSLKKKQYPAIWAWGWYMRSYDYYMEMQEEKAIQHAAPKGAFGQVGGFGANADEWKIWSGISNPVALDYMKDALSGIEDYSDLTN